jgi:hypothetical protein
VRFSYALGTHGTRRQGSNADRPHRFAGKVEAAGNEPAQDFERPDALAQPAARSVE